MLTRLIPIIVAAFACWVLGWLPAEMALGVLPMFLLPSCLCCPTGGQCAKCLNPTCHTSYQIVITGVTNGSSCSDCASLNGTFTATGTCTAGVQCQWTSTSPTACSGNVNGINMSVIVALGPITVLSLTMNSTTTGIVWSDVVDAGGASVDCGFSAKNVPQSFGSSVFCDGSASTCTVTAL